MVLIVPRSTFPDRVFGSRATTCDPEHRDRADAVPHHRDELRVQLLRVPVRTARAVFDWKRRAGYPEAEINAGLGVRGQGYLLRTLPFPEDHLIRANARALQALAPELIKNTPPFAAGTAPDRPLRWPVKPFDGPHQVRGTFGEVRGLQGVAGTKGLEGDALATFLGTLNPVLPVGRRIIHHGIDIVAYRQDGSKVDLQQINGAVALFVNATDVQSNGGNETGVYRLGYSVKDGNATAVVGPYQCVQMDCIPPEPIGNILYTTQSTRHKFQPIFWVRLTLKSPSADGTLHTGHLAPGPYTVEVVAGDVMGNNATRAFPITIIPG